MKTNHRKTRRPDITAQHRELRHTLDAVEATSELTRLVPLLEALRAQLVAHFADEERADGGLADAFGVAAPRLYRRLAGVLAEHSELLEMADALIRRARALLDGELRGVVRDTRALSRRLKRHEAQETELLADAVYADIGGG